MENAKWRQETRDFLLASKLYASRSRGNGLNWTTWVSLLYMYTRQISTENRSRFKRTTKFSDAKEMASVRLRNLPEISIWRTPRCDVVCISDEILEQRLSSIFNPLPSFQLFSPNPKCPFAWEWYLVSRTIMRSPCKRKIKGMLYLRILWYSCYDGTAYSAKTNFVSRT